MFKIPFEDTDVPYIKCVAYRDGYSVEFNLEGDEEEGDLSSVAVIEADESLREEFLEDVECEKQSAAYGGMPVYSLRTASDPEKLGRLMKLNHTRAFVILKQDKDKFLKM